MLGVGEDFAHPVVVDFEVEGDSIAGDGVGSSRAEGFEDALAGKVFGVEAGEAFAVGAGIAEMVVGRGDDADLEATSEQGAHRVDGPSASHGMAEIANEAAIVLG